MVEKVKGVSLCYTSSSCSFFPEVFLRNTNPKNYFFSSGNWFFCSILYCWTLGVEKNKRLFYLTLFPTIPIRYYWNCFYSCNMIVVFYFRMNVWVALIWEIVELLTLFSEKSSPLNKKVTLNGNFDWNGNSFELKYSLKHLSREKLTKEALSRSLGAMESNSNLPVLIKIHSFTRIEMTLRQ